MHAAAERGEDAQPPVADLVAEALDDDRAVARHDAGGALLLAEELDEVAGGQVVEVELGLERLRVLVDRPAGEGADRLAELTRAAEAVALPERHGGGHTGSGRDDHAVARDVLDPPARRAEQERLARPGLVDHLLVELADAAAVGQVDAEQPAIGDRPGVRDGQRAGAAAGADRAGHAVPDDARPQLAELLARIAAVEHVEHVLELGAAQLGVGVRARDECVQLVDAVAVVPRLRGDGDDLLREHVERVARHDGRLDLALAHPLGDHRALDQVGAELREDAALRRVADVVAGAADALQPGGDRLRRLDLEHEVDGAHVDAELEAGGRDQAGQLAGLELVLDQQALLPCQRAMVGTGDRLFSKLVEAQGEPLGAAAVVDEDQRRAVLAHQLEQLGVDRGPDRLAGRLLAGALERVELRAGVAGLDHRLDGHVDLEVERLAHPGIDHGALALGADQEAADLVERVLRRRQADALHVTAGRLGQPLERERQVRAALCLRDGVDLVHDHLLGAVEDLRRLAGEHQVQRLGRRDEDVRRLADHRLALALRRVAGADGDLDVGADAAQRRAQVLLHVVGERLERRDVDEPGAVRGRLGDEPVERPQERRERLAGAGGRADQGVLARGDRRPGLRLRRRRRIERPPEPLPDLRRKGRERHSSQGTAGAALSSSAPHTLTAAWRDRVCAARPGCSAPWAGTRSAPGHRR